MHGIACLLETIAYIDSSIKIDLWANRNFLKITKHVLLYCSLFNVKYIFETANVKKDITLELNYLLHML